jgi:hypothetical protein
MLPNHESSGTFDGLEILETDLIVANADVEHLLEKGNELEDPEGVDDSSRHQGPGLVQVRDSTRFDLGQDEVQDSLFDSCRVE